jgi:hypothetical protein
LRRELPIVVTATRLEARAVRRALPGAPAVRAGVGLTRLQGALEGPVVTCGLAGSLCSSLPVGTVVVPRCVLRPDGGALWCDPALVGALVAGARRLGQEPVLGPMVTSTRLITGAQRAAWAERGCVAADMETGLLDAERVASVRVVLDTPERELSGAWERPLAALLQPAAWAELPWLLREAPRCARLAAQVLASAFEQESSPRLPEEERFIRR